jgi:hypothetical protein
MDRVSAFPDVPIGAERIEYSRWTVFARPSGLGNVWGNGIFGFSLCQLT